MNNPSDLLDVLIAKGVCGQSDGMKIEDKFPNGLKYSARYLLLKRLLSGTSFA